MPNRTQADVDAVLDAATRGTYLDAVIYACRPCDQRSYCRDECECHIAAAIAAASNPYTVPATGARRHFCCGDPGDCHCAG